MIVFLIFKISSSCGYVSNSEGVSQAMWETLRVFHRASYPQH